MKLSCCTSLAALLFSAILVHGAESIDDAMKRATLEYEQRLRTANDELTQARSRITQEKTPLLLAMRSAETRIIAAEAAIIHLETGQERFLDHSRQLSTDLEALRKTTGYLNTLAHDGLNGLDHGLLPGERPRWGERIRALQEEFNDPAKLANGQEAVDTATLLFEQVRQALGGYTIEGTSMLAGDNQIIKGTFAFVGPEVFFRPGQGGIPGSVRMQEGMEIPVTYPLAGWKADAAAGFFRARWVLFMPMLPPGRRYDCKRPRAPSGNISAREESCPTPSSALEPSRYL